MIVVMGRFLPLLILGYLKKPLASFSLCFLDRLPPIVLLGECKSRQNLIASSLSHLVIFYKLAKVSVSTSREEW